MKEYTKHDYKFYMLTAVRNVEYMEDEHKRYKEIDFYRQIAALSYEDWVVWQKGDLVLPDVPINDNDKVYEFLYNSDCCESAPATISIHITRKSAEMAMEFHKNEVKTAWEKEDLADSERDLISIVKRTSYPFDYDQSWNVRETKLSD